MAYFYDQHLAWQQRITKDEHVTTFRPPSKSSVESQLSTKDSFLLNRPDLRNTNVFAEVRGKYARQPFHQVKKPELSSFSSTENPLLARPTTSGSLMARNMLPLNPSHKRSQSHLEESPKVLEKQGKQLGMVSRSISSKTGKKIVVGDSLVEENLKVDDLQKNGKNPETRKAVNGRNARQPVKDEQDLNLGAVAKDEDLKQAGEPLATDPDEYLDQVDDLEDDLQEVKDEEGLENSESSQDGSKYSHYSSASQKRIFELEAQLREERLKRHELEKSLQKKNKT